jgi:hypothetical protein
MYAAMLAATLPLRRADLHSDEIAEQYQGH